MEKEKKKNIVGWITVIITISVSSLWAFWGIVENFHEGWYSVSVWENLFMLIFQYMGNDRGAARATKEMRNNCEILFTKMSV